MDRDQPRRDGGLGRGPALLAALGVLAATVLAYLPALRGGMLWDDAAHVTPPRLRDAAGLWRIWTHLGATQQYYPVLHSAFWLEHRIWGDSLLGYHLANVLLHALAACLFARILAMIRPPGAGLRGAEWLAAGAFALHPVCAESVAWISEQKNTLSLVLYLLSAAAYLRFDTRRRAGWYALAFLLFILACLSKSVTATLPAAILLALCWRNGRIALRRDVAPLLPWFAAGIASGLLTAWVERVYIGATGRAFELGLPERFLLAGSIVWFYLGKLLWPSGLMFIYPRWAVVPSAGWCLGLAALAAALAGLWAVRGWSRAPLIAFLFFAGSLFPALGFFNVYPFVFSYVADHFQYLACLGIIGLVADGGAGLALGAAGRLAGPSRQIWRAAATLGCASVLAILFALTWRQAGRYSSARTLYSETLSLNPQAWMAENNLGVLDMEAMSYADAERHFERAIALRPEYADAHNNLGNALSKLPGRSSAAVAQFREALRLNPGMSEAHANLGTALAASPMTRTEGVSELRAALRGNEDDPGYARTHADLGAALAAGPGGIAAAAPEFEASLRLDPSSADAWDSYGVALAGAGRASEAADKFRRAIGLRPDEATFHNNLGGALTEIGSNAEAIAQYRDALRLDPRSARAHFNLGQALWRAGDVEEAVAEHRSAIRMAPDSPEARVGLGSILFRRGDYAGAAEQYGEAARLVPGSAKFRYYLGLSLRADGRLEDAIRELGEAVRLDPGYSDAHYNLGVALRMAGRDAEAAAEFSVSGRAPP